jgi:hypothetical protein
MNDLNALIFGLIGTSMELLPRVFPSWFPPTGADQASARALWLDVVGAVQIGMGAGYILRAHFVPAVLRIFSAVPAGDRGTLALSDPRILAGR